MSTTPRRARILAAGIQATTNNRNKDYGEPAKNLGCAGHLKMVMRSYIDRQITAGELEALDMVITKIARAVTGKNPGEDTFIDGATYFAIAGELYAAEQDRNAKEAGETPPDRQIDSPSVDEQADKLLRQLTSVGDQQEG